MTHLIVNRVALAVCLLAFGAAALFAWLVMPAPALVAVAGAAPAGDAVPSGARLFAQHCARCHSLEESLTALRADAAGLDSAAIRLRTLLRGHGAANDAEDALIVAYLGDMAATPQ